ncbi:MAG: DUF1345 domain-containing protein [Alphaproteobacteria bacterium]
MTGHVRHHGRFYLALAGGAVAGAAIPIDGVHLRLVLGGDVFFLVYLAATAVVAWSATPDSIRARSEDADEGIAVIFLLTIASVVLSLGAIFALVSRGEALPAAHLALAAGSVLLGWLTLHTIFGFHYAHVFYAEAEDSPPDERHDAEGLAFPATDAPGIWEFLYHAFVIGMTAQVSDVEVVSTRMRRIVLVQSIVAFFYNTVLLALAVNIAASRT